MIIGISGRATAGKTLASMVFRQRGYSPASFASSLRLVCVEGLGYSLEDLYERKQGPAKQPTSEDWKQLTEVLGFEIPLQPTTVTTVREVLQYVGMEVRKVNPDYWVDRIKYQDRMVFDDVRFPNERAKIRELGGKLILIVRDVPLMDHPSETSLGSFDEYDYVIFNDSSVNEFLKKVKTACSELENVNDD